MCLQVALKDLIHGNYEFIDTKDTFLQLLVPKTTKSVAL